MRTALLIVPLITGLIVAAEFANHSANLVSRPSKMRSSGSAQGPAVQRKGETRPLFRALAVTSTASDHLKMIACAGPALKKIARENNLTIDISADTGLINDDNLKKYQVFIQLHEA